MAVEQVVAVSIPAKPLQADVLGLKSMSLAGGMKKPTLQCFRLVSHLFLVLNSCWGLEKLLMSRKPLL
jgi:hypothetical protein